MTNERTRQREVAALAAAMAELGTTDGTIVTRDAEEEIKTSAGTVRVIPAWRFLLETSTG